MSTRETMISNLENIITTCEYLQSSLEDYPMYHQEKARYSGAFLNLLYYADEVYEVFAPNKMPGEIFGLPKENVFGAKEEERLTKGGIDYTAWFKEKTGDIKRGVKYTLKYWKSNLDEIQLVDGSPSPEEYVNEGILSGLHMAKVQSETVLDMLKR